MPGGVNSDAGAHMGGAPPGFPGGPGGPPGGMNLGAML